MKGEDQHRLLLIGCLSGHKPKGASLRNVAAASHKRVSMHMAETLLYVDDNALRCEAMEARLSHLGYTVVTANNGLDALGKFAAQQIDLAIVDYYMPGMCGDLVALERKSSKPQVPVVIFSGTFTLSEMVIAFVDGFISTSDEPEALLDKIAEVLAPHRASRAS